MTERLKQQLSQTFGFIGAGSMGGALIQGVVAAGLVKPENLRFYDPDPDRRRELASLGVTPAADNAAVMRSQVIILAVKPQMMGQVLTEIQELAQPRHLIISLAAGIPLALLEEDLPQARVLRAMPNTPLLVQAGITALAPGQRATSEDVALARHLFGAGGQTLVVAESHLDAVTGLSGSGPAYVAVFLEALTDGGVKMGLPRPLAWQLALHTVLGAARLCLEKELQPGSLKDMVTSPGGTTISGLHALEQGGFRGLVMNAVEAATWRAQDLAAAGSQR